MWRAVVCSSLLGTAVATNTKANYCDPANCPTETPTVWYGCVTPTLPQTDAPTAPLPTNNPATSAPSTSPVTSSPSKAPVGPTLSPTSPSKSPSTSSPSMSPSTSSPSMSPSRSPSTSSPSMSPSVPPSTSAPSTSPTADDLAPEEAQPSVSPSTSSPSMSPSVSPSTSSPSTSPSTSVPSTSPSKSPSTSPPTVTAGGPTAKPTAGPTSSPCQCQLKKGSGFKMPLPTYTCPAIASTPRPIVAATVVTTAVINSNPAVKAAASRPTKVVTSAAVTSAFVVGTVISFAPGGDLKTVSWETRGPPTVGVPDAAGNQKVTVPALIDLAELITDVAGYKLSYTVLIANQLGINFKQIKDLLFQREGTNDVFGRKGKTLAASAVNVLYTLCEGTCDGSAVFGGGAAANDDDDSSIIAVAVVVPIVGIMIIVILVWYFCCSGDDEETSKTGQHAPYGDQQAEPEEKPAELDPEV